MCVVLNCKSNEKTNHISLISCNPTQYFSPTVKRYKMVDLCCLLPHCLDVGCSKWALKNSALHGIMTSYQATFSGVPGGQYINYKY